MDPIELAERTFVALKSTLVEDRGVGTDIPTMLLTARGHQLIEAYPLDDLRSAGAIMTTAIMLSDADRAFVGTDVYYLLDGDAHLEPGELARRFAGGDPGVCEAIHITCAADDGPTCSIFRTYDYDGRSVRWVERFELEGRGPYRGALQVAFEERRNAPPELPALIKPGTRVHLLDQQPLGADIGLLFALSLGCPCGSGRAIQDCCSVRN
jgi:hypothetical protein